MAEFDGGVDEVALGRANPKTTTARLGGGASGGRRRGEGGGELAKRCGWAAFNSSSLSQVASSSEWWLH
uniref:Uncharacterized protein n=1 Tax=Oryza sativa subsp. japonica TaxID=39947 RepID=Q6UU88_ORYSJ|nr:hypothetical protein OSJNBa0023H09.9 [Oryza sativa Japonica Group]